jgi:hypothetical protein
MAIVYEFSRSVLVGVARNHGASNGMVIVLDGVALVIASVLEPDETRWYHITATFILTEVVRYLWTTPHLFR